MISQEGSLSINEHLFAVAHFVELVSEIRYTPEGSIVCGLAYTAQEHTNTHVLSHAELTELVNAFDVLKANAFKVPINGVRWKKLSRFKQRSKIKELLRARQNFAVSLKALKECLDHYDQTTLLIHRAIQTTTKEYKAVLNETLFEKTSSPEHYEKVNQAHKLRKQCYSMLDDELSGDRDTNPVEPLQRYVDQVLRLVNDEDRVAVSIRLNALLEELEVNLLLEGRIVVG